MCPEIRDLNTTAAKISSVGEMQTMSFRLIYRAMVRDYGQEHG